MILDAQSNEASATVSVMVKDIVKVEVKPPVKVKPPVWKKSSSSSSGMSWLLLGLMPLLLVRIVRKKNQ